MTDLKLIQEEKEFWLKFREKERQAQSKAMLSISKEDTMVKRKSITIKDIQKWIHTRNQNCHALQPELQKKLEQIENCKIIVKSGIVSKELRVHNAEKIISILDSTLPDLLFFVENALDYHLLENVSMDDKEKDLKFSWNPIEDHLVIPARQPLYLTVRSKKNRSRILLEGFTEDNRWFNSEGIELGVLGYEVIAWTVKRIPDLYLEG